MKLRGTKARERALALVLCGGLGSGMAKEVFPEIFLVVVEARSSSL